MQIVWGKSKSKREDSGELEREYESVLLDRQEICLYDFIHLRSRDPELPFVGLVVRLWENRITKKGNVVVRWLYRREDLDIEVDAGDQELFLALGSGVGAEDSNDLNVVEEKCAVKVLYCPEGVANWAPTKEEISGARYYVSRCYDFLLGEVHCNLREALERIGAVKKCPRRPADDRLERPVKKKLVVTHEAAPQETRPEKEKRPALKNAFKKLGWNDKLDEAFDKGKVIMLMGFGTGYTSEELKEALVFLFKDIRADVEVAVVPPKCCKFESKRGEAVLAFRDADKGNRVLKTIQENCVILSEEEGPCIATAMERPRAKKFPGHLPVEKYWRVQTEKFKEAVSTAHCSQPNTIEYEMALEWRLMDEEHKLQIQTLRKQQEQEVADLKAKLRITKIS